MSQLAIERNQLAALSANRNCVKWHHFQPSKLSQVAPLSSNRTKSTDTTFSQIHLAGHYLQIRYFLFIVKEEWKKATRKDA